MLIEGTHYRTIWLGDDRRSVQIIDQRQLPFAVEIETIRTSGEMATAIREMHLRGAPLIGAAAAYGVYLACLDAEKGPPPAFDDMVDRAIAELDAARPTAVNLHWALERQRRTLAAFKEPAEKVTAVLRTAISVADEDVGICASLGQHGSRLLESISKQKGDAPVNVLTHCNAGWLATVDHGTATASIYEASQVGIPLHVWVDETRPRLQGALTSWELSQNGVENTVICDNSGGHLMQHGLVDVVIVGTDRTSRNGDVANKIGTYLKALAAHDNGVPFYVALPSPTFDPSMPEGVGTIPIEERDPAEVLTVRGARVGAAGGEAGQGTKPPLDSLSLFAPETTAANHAFDVTPARLVTGYITEHGVFTSGELATALRPSE